MSAGPDWFVLHRVEDDPAKAQTVQVAHTAWALARAGARVVLPVRGEPVAVHEALGLTPIPAGLRLVRIGRGAAGSVRLRAALAAFLVATAGRGIVACRTLPHADAVLRATRGRARLLFEAHEVADRLVAEGGAPALRAREARVLRGAEWVVANAPGTRALLLAAHGPLRPIHVIPNGARPAATPGVPGVGAGVVGSVRPYKDPLTVARAAALLGGGVTWVGADAASTPALVAASGGALRVEPPVPHREVAARLAGFATLILPLSPDDAFGAALTSPLKLWDAFAAGVPLVAADTAAVRAAAPDGWLPYVPGDPASLAAAVRRAAEVEVRAALLARASRHVRTWDDRAAELLALVGAG